MSKTATKTDPKLWEKVKDEITKGDKGGKPGQWSARKAQMASQEYQKRGGGYAGDKPDDDNSLKEWTEEEWGTKSGKRSEDTGERYLPKEARENLSDEEYKRTTAKKREDSKKGKQFSKQPDDVAEKAKKYRDGGESSKDELYEKAKKQGVAGRSKMNKDELKKAVD